MWQALCGMNAPNTNSLKHYSLHIKQIYSIWLFYVQFQKSILLPLKGFKFPREWGDLHDQMFNAMYMYKTKWNIQRGRKVLEKNPFMGEVWIFSETTQKCTLSTIYLFACLSVPLSYLPKVFNNCSCTASVWWKVCNIQRYNKKIFFKC